MAKQGIYDGILDDPSWEARIVESPPLSRKSLESLWARLPRETGPPYCEIVSSAEFERLWAMFDEDGQLRPKALGDWLIEHIL